MTEIRQVDRDDIAAQTLRNQSSIMEALILLIEPKATKHSPLFVVMQLADNIGATRGVLSNANLDKT